jgi:uncharacterized membrane protein
MDLRILYSIILTFLPGSELRIGLPVAMIYARNHDIPLALVFLLIVLVNILLIFIIFFFLDHLHHWLMKFKFYRRLFKASIKRIQKRMDKFEKKYSTLGFFALTFFVAVPLPISGAWSGSLISWLLGLDRKKSIFSIALGVFIAGLLVFLGMFGFLSFLF